MKYIEDNVVDDYELRDSQKYHIHDVLLARQVQELREIRYILQRMKSKMGGLSGETEPG